jgi:uncharacterized linocin/CFP29 family protein
MDDRNAQVGWTEAQWNRVREEVLQAWQRVRVAGSFLPIYGPLPPSTQVVPSEVLKPDGSVDDRATAALIEIALPVTLSRQQIWEEDLSSALLQFRRRATQLGQLEDWFIFNGTYPSIASIDLSAKAQQFAKVSGLPDYRPELAHLNAPDSSQRARISGTPTPIAGASQGVQIEGMRQRNPGSLGLIEAPRVERLGAEAEQARQQAEQARQEAEQAEQARQLAPRNQQARQRAVEAGQRAVEAGQRAVDAGQRAQLQTWDKSPLNNDGLMKAIVNAINSLEDNGYVAPYVCVFGRNPYEEAFTPISNSTVLPRDRIEPLIGRELLHASGIDIPPYELGKLYNLNREEWQSRGVLLSLANEAIDLALAAEATPEFRQVDLEGRYVFSVFERFALRIKDAKAIVSLMFETRAAPRTPAAPAAPATAAAPAAPGTAAAAATPAAPAAPATAAASEMPNS